MLKARIGFSLMNDWLSSLDKFVVFYLPLRVVACLNPALAFPHIFASHNL